MDKFRNITNGFNYVYEKKLEANETVIVSMPTVSPNKRSINDVGWQTNGNVTLYGTLSSKPQSEEALWQEILPRDEVNKAVSAIKIVNGNDECSIVIRVILC